MAKDNLGIYIHIPFCKKKCPYCSFYSVPNEENLVDRYITVLCGEIKKWGGKICSEVDTIYFGGGTPSTLKTEEILKILFCVKENFMIKFPEVTIEINPGDYKNIDFEKLCYYGVNRVSLGAQSIKNSALRILGRRHDFKDIVNSIETMIQRSVTLKVYHKTRLFVNKIFTKLKYSKYHYKISEITAFETKNPFSVSLILLLSHSKKPCSLNFFAFSK